MAKKVRKPKARLCAFDLSKECVPECRAYVAPPSEDIPEELEGVELEPNCRRMRYELIAMAVAEGLGTIAAALNGTLDEPYQCDDCVAGKGQETKVKDKGEVRLYS